jgi:RimJ/RimL family protein N-acetyltransferase
MICGQTVVLRAFTRADLPTFVRWFNDQDVTKFLGGDMWPMSPESEDRWFERMLEDRQNRGVAIETLPRDGQPGRLIGNVGLHHPSERNHNVELGIVIGEKDCWSQGYGTDAIRTMLRYAFDELNYHKVYLRVYDFNRRAIRCYEKCGFQIEGQLRQHMFRNGAWHDEIVMGVLCDEFRALPWQHSV